jgi:hypothetical protein
MLMFCSYFVWQITDILNKCIRTITPVIPETREEDWEFKVSLGYKVKSCVKKKRENTFYNT